MKAYLAYTRVSTVKQGERGSSLQEQKSAIEAYASLHGLSIAGWFEDRETAAKVGRRMFNRMLAELTDGDARGVIIHKIDRSARNLKDWAHLGELIDLGVEVHFAHESLDLASRGGRLSADIQAVVAADYVRNLRQEVRKGFYGRLKQGLYPLPAPAGYLDRGKGRPKEIDPVLGPLVRQAFDLYGSGVYSLDRLRLELHRRGLRGRTGRAFSKNGLSELLKNRFYLGMIHIARTGESFQGVHEPLITKRQYDRVQDVRSGRLRPRATTNDFTFRRLIMCVHCDRALVGERQKGHVYYRCHGQECRGTSLRETDILAGLRSVLELLALAPEDLRGLVDLVTDARAEARQREEAERQRLTLQLGRIDDRMTRLTDALLDMLIDQETFQQRKTLLLEERRGLMDELAAPSQGSEGDDLLKKLELGQSAYLGLETEDPDKIRAMVDLTSSNLEVNGKNLAIRLRFPFAELANWCFVTYGAPFPAVVRTFSPVSTRKRYVVVSKVERPDGLWFVCTVGVRSVGERRETHRHKPPGNSDVAELSKTLIPNSVQKGSLGRPRSPLRLSLG